MFSWSMFRATATSSAAAAELADITALPSEARQRWGDELLQFRRAKNF